MTKYLIFAALLVAACNEVTTDNFTNPVPSPPDSCVVIADLPGCDFGSVSYACDGTDRPDDPDTDLVCSAGTAGVGSAQLFCCIPYEQATSECTPDPTIPGCGGVAVGFSCAGQDSPPTTPGDADPTIACSAAMASGSANRYCCNTTAVPQTCAADQTVACHDAEVGYTCVGSDTPTDAGAPLDCATGAVAGTFCCTL
jgi:hypothetical protein